MPAFSPRLAEIETRLERLRTKLNRDRLQDAVYLTSALLCVTVSILISLAVGDHPVEFAYALWPASLLVAVVAGANVARVYCRWLSLEGTARIADRRAKLEDRLSTVVSRLGSGRESPIATILISQVLAMSERWTPVAIAPARVARSFFILLATLLLLGGTILFTDNRSDSVQKPQHRTAVMKAVDSAVPQERTNTNRRENHQGGNSTSHSDPSAAPPSDRFETQTRRNPSAQAGAQQSRSDVSSGSPAGQSGAAKADPIAERVRGAIRRALRSEPLEKRGQEFPRTAERKNAGTNLQKKSDGSQPAVSEGKHNGTSRHTSQQRADEEKPGVRGGFGSGAGAGKGAAPFGSSATATSKGATGPGLQTFTLKLARTIQPGYQQTRPQTGGDGEHDDQIAPAHNQPLEPQSSQTGGLHRAAIAPQYEPTVRRIFNRQAEN